MSQSLEQAQLLALRDQVQDMLDEPGHSDYFRTRLGEIVIRLNEYAATYCPHTSSAYVETSTTLTCVLCGWTTPNPNVFAGGPDAA